MYFFTTPVAHKMNKIRVFKLFELQGFQKLSPLSKRSNGRLTKWVNFAFLDLQTSFHQVSGLQNEQSLLFWGFLSFKAFKSMSLSTFSPSKRLQNEQSLPFLSFSSFKALKSPHFCQNSSLSTFSPSGEFSKMSKVCLWWLFELQGLQAVRASNFVKRGLWVRFHQAGGLQNEQSLRFWVFQALELLKASNFVKRGLWVRFHQAGGLQNEQSLHFQALEL